MKINLTGEEFCAILRGERKEYIQNYPYSYSSEKAIVLTNASIPFVNSEHLQYGNIESVYAIVIVDCHFLFFAGLSIKCKGLLKFESCRFYEFLVISHLESESFIMTNCQVDMPTVISGCKTHLSFDSKFGEIEFRDNEFKGFSLSGKYRGIKISSGIFHGSVHIFRAKEIKTLSFEGGKYESGIYFKESTIQERVNFLSINFENSIWINDCNFGIFDMIDCEINNRFTIDKGVFDHTFSFLNTNIKEELIIDGGEFKKEILFDGGKFKNIIFKGGTFFRILFRNGLFESFINFRGGKYGDITFKGGVFSRYVDFWGKKEKKVEVESANFEIKQININGGDFKENIWIKDGLIEELNIRPLLMSRIHIIPSDGTKYLYSIPKIDNLNITAYFYKDSFLQISDVSLKKLSFTNFTNIGTITVANVKIDGELEITNSDLGKTTFIDCDFSQIDLKFKSSKITDTSLNGTLLPINITAQDNIQKRLALSQIKKIYENRGDLVEANRYFAEEMNVYLEVLPNSWEKANIWLNKWTNNHGQSWQRALGLIFGGSLFFYTFYCFFLGFRFDFTLSGVQEYGRILCFLPEFINPIRKADFLPKALLESESEPSVSALVYLWDNIGKIFITYFIYQLIAAFRKHGKKS